MAGNSQRKGAVRRKGATATPAGSGGRVRRGLEGRGPTPKAEDRPYHKAYRTRGPEDPGRTPGGKPKGGSRGAPQTTGERRAPKGTDGRPPRPRTGDAGPRQKQAHGASGAGPEWIIGRNPVLEALQAGLPVKRAYVAEGVERDDRLRDILKLAAERGLPLLAATRPELDKLTRGGVHQGVALQLPAYEYADPHDVLETALEAGADGLVVALDQVTDPRNLGAIIRSAAAFGAHGVVIPERRSAQMTAAAWKTSAGAAARVPVARVTNLNRTLAAYAEAGFLIVGLDGDGDPIGTVDVDGPVLLVVGSEGEGLSRLVREHCDVLAAIPIAADVESLNASVAAAIALYEIGRRRG